MTHGDLVQRLREWLRAGGGLMPRECFASDVVLDDGSFRVVGDDAFGHIEGRAPFESSSILFDVSGDTGWMVMLEGVDPTTLFKHRETWAFVFADAVVRVIWRATSKNLPDTPYGNEFPLAPTSVPDPRQR